MSSLFRARSIRLCPLFTMAMVASCAAPVSSPEVGTSPDAVSSLEGGLAEGTWNGGLENRLQQHDLQLRGVDGQLGYASSAQDLSATFSDGEVVIRPISTPDAFAGVDWRVAIRTARVGQQTLQDVSAGPVVSGGCSGLGDDLLGSCLARAEQDLGFGVTGWWDNGPDGIQQGWTLNTPFDESGPVSLELEVSGMDVEVSPDGTTVVLSNAVASFELQGLTAWDSAGTGLAVHWESAEGGVRVVVEAEDAQWPIHVDPLYTDPDWTFTATAFGNLSYNDHLSAGDVNGDGFEDLLVGAPTTMGNRGEVFVFLGSASGLSDTAAWSLLGPTSLWFGLEVATGGDVNGDGFDDVAVGNIQGTTEVYLGAAGSPPVQSTPWTTLTALSTGNGGPGLTMGDLDGDGFDDVVARSRNQGFYVQSGTSGTPAAPASLSMSDTPIEMDATGDVNGDGFDDLLVLSQSRRLYVYPGTAGVFGTSTNFSVPGAAPAQLAVGDTNGDGFDDLYVSARTSYVHIGGSAGGLGTPVSMACWTTDCALAIAVGDHDGDGFDDLSVSNLTAGLRLFRGSASGVGAVPAWTLAADGLTAFELATADVDSDGFADLLVKRSNQEFRVYLGTDPGADPMADAGSDFAQFEGAVPLDASGSSDPDGTLVAWRWDCDADGVFETLGETASCVLGGGTGPLGCGERTVTLEVEDDDGLRHYDDVVVCVTDLPVSPDLGADRTALPFETVSFSAAFVDPGGDDGMIFTSPSCGGGALSNYDAVAGSFDCTFSTMGAFSVELQGRSDGNVSANSFVQDTVIVTVAGGDGDLDGFIDAAIGGDDCDDEDLTIFPGAPDAFGDGVDQDCDGQDGALKQALELVAGDLVIAEIMDQPNAGSDRWIEIDNPTADPIQLLGVQLNGGGTYTFPDTLLLPGERVVVGTLGAPSQVDLAMSGVTSLVAPTLTFASTTIATGSASAGGTGSSAVWDGTRWCMGVVPYETLNHGSPGVANTCDWSLGVHFQWTIDDVHAFNGPMVLDNTWNGPDARFSTSNSGTGEWTVSADGVGHNGTFTFDETGVVYVGSRPFGGQWTGGMTGVPANTAGQWTGEVHVPGAWPPANQPPVISSVAVDPAVPDETSTVVCNVVAADPDLDALDTTVTWTVNGSSVGTAATLTGADFDKGDVIGCSADVEANGELVQASSSNVTVVNAPPTDPSVSVSLDYGTLLLTCTAAGAVDPDPLDSISHVYSWTSNGTPVAGQAGATVDLTTVSGTTVACTATATDGEANSNTVGSANTVAVASPVTYTLRGLGDNELDAFADGVAVITDHTDFLATASATVDWYPGDHTVALRVTDFGNSPRMVRFEVTQGGVSVLDTSALGDWRAFDAASGEPVGWELGGFDDTTWGTPLECSAAAAAVWEGFYPLLGIPDPMLGVDYIWLTDPDCGLNGSPVNPVLFRATVTVP